MGQKEVIFELSGSNYVSLSKNTLYHPSIGEEAIISGYDRKTVDGAKNQ